MSIVITNIIAIYINVSYFLLHNLRGSRVGTVSLLYKSGTNQKHLVVLRSITNHGITRRQAHLIIVFEKIKKKMPMETRCFRSSLNFEYTRRNISLPLALSTSLCKKKFQTWKKKNEENSSRSGVGQNRPEKNPAERLIRSGEIPSPRQASIDKTNDCVKKSERGAIVRGWWSVHNTAGDKWRAPARRLIQKHFAAGV